MAKRMTVGEPLTAQVRERPLSQRGLVTRRKLLDAAIQLLSQQGYGATTTQAVVELAAVSRGSMLHQFQTRLDLMVSTAEHAMELMLEDSRNRFRLISDPVEALERYPDVVWEIQNAPSGAAVTEILLAARWDVGLAERLPPIVRRIDKIIDATFTDLAARCGASDLPGLLAQARALIAATRGMAIELTFDRNRESIWLAWETLKRNHREFVRARLPAVRRTKPRS